MYIQCLKVLQSKLTVLDHVVEPLSGLRGGFAAKCFMYKKMVNSTCYVLCFRALLQFRLF